MGKVRPNRLNRWQPTVFRPFFLQIAFRQIYKNDSLIIPGFSRHELRHHRR